MVKALILADPHAGVPGRLNDVIWSLRVAEECAAELNIDVVIGLGDLFHNRASVEIDALCAVHDFFQRVRKRGQQWIWIPGNHDMFLKHSWEINSLKPISELITLIDSVKVIKIADSRFWTLPFIHFESSYMRALARVEERYEDGDVLLTHIGTMGAVKNVCFLLKDWSMVTFAQSKFDRVYTGHFHSVQQVGHNVWYPGSPIPFKADEGDCPHGFFIYDLATRTHEFVDVWKAGARFFPEEKPPPNYLTITDATLTDIDDADLRELAGNNVVRVAVSDEWTSNQKTDVQDRLRALGAHDVRWMTVAPDDGLEVKSVATMEAGEGADLFEAWLKADQIGIKGLETKVLRQVNAEVMHDGNERYQYEEED